LLPTKRIFVIVAVTWAFSLWCRKGKAFCERRLAFHRQQPKKDKQNDFASPLEKFLRRHMLLACATISLLSSTAFHIKQRLASL